MNEFPNRITGTEMEWGIVAPLKDSLEASRQLTIYEVDPFVEAYLDANKVPFIGVPSSCFLGNGARFYNDVNHKEYATPEDSSYLGTVANEIAGERIMYAIAQRVAEKYPGCSLNKRVLDDMSTAWGYHESYSVNSSIEIDAEALVLHGVHLATRNVFFGAGSLRVNGDFVLAQKAVTTDADYHATTTSVKPVVNLRIDHLGDSSRFRRVHVTSGDPNMSPWATQMKLGTTSLVLRLMENGHELPHLQLNDLVASTHSVAYDLQLNKGIELKNGAVKTALEIQHELCRAARKLSGYIDLSHQDLWTIEEWERACADMSQDPALLYDRADWVFKKRMLDKKRAQQNLEWTDEKMLRYEKSFSEIGPDTPSESLRSGLWQQWMPPEQLIQERQEHPPKYTRAHIRGRFIQALAHHNDAKGVGWERVERKGKTVKLSNPYARHDERVEELMAEVA